MLVDPLDHVPVEFEFAEDYGGKVNPAACGSLSVTEYLPAFRTGGVTWGGLRAFGLGPGWIVTRIA
ncbi:MAG: hypothetical protein ACLP8S_28395 [Solirubrobacteraceae bacterium]